MEITDFMDTEYTFYLQDRKGKTLLSLATDTVASEDLEEGSVPVFKAKVYNKLKSYDLLELEVPADHEDVAKIEEEMYLVFEDINGYREYVINEVEDVDGDSITRTIGAELSSIELLDKVMEEPLETTSKQPSVVLEEVLEGTRWEVGEVDNSLYNQAFNQDIQFKSVLEVIDLISSNYRADIQFSYQVQGGTVTKRYVNLYKQFGRNAGKRYEIGKDITSISRTVDTTQIKTAILPYGYKAIEDENGEQTQEKELVTIEEIEWDIDNGDPVNKPKGQKYLEDLQAKEEYGRYDSNGNLTNRTLAMEFKEENEEDELTASEMAEMAWVQLGRYTQPKVTYEADVVDLYRITGDKDLLHERVAIGDSVAVLDDNFSKPIEIFTRINELERDLLNPLNNAVVLGDANSYFNVNETANQEDQVDNLEKQVRDLGKEINKRYNLNKEYMEGAGGNDVYLGTDTPSIPDTGDIWFRPDTEKPNVTNLFIYDGTNWEEKGLGSDELDGLEQQINDLQQQTRSDIQTINKDIEDATSDISGVSEDVKGLEQDISDLNINVSGNNSDIADLSDNVESVAGDVSNLGDSIENVERDITTLRTDTETAIQDKVSSSEFESYRTQTDNAIEDRITSDELETVRVQLDDAIQDRVTDGEFGTFRTQTEDAIQDKVDSDTFTSYRTQTDSAIEDKVDSDEFTSYRNQTDDAIQDRVTGDEMESAITTFENNINLRVENKVDKDDVINQINISDEAITIDGKQLNITAETFIEEAVIKSGHIQALSADKVNFGTLDGDKANIVNLNADNITAGDLNLANLSMTDGAGNTVLGVDTDSGEVELTVSKLTIGVRDIEDELSDVEDELGNKAGSGDLTGLASEDYVDSGDSEAKSHADSVAQAKADLAEEQAKAYADGEVSKEEQARIDDAKAKLKEAKEHADTKAINAESSAKSHADSVAQAKADLAETEAKAYADGEVSKEEQARIDQAKENLEEAKRDASNKANDAENNAKTHADSVAKAEAELAETQAKAYADGVLSDEEAERIQEAKDNLEEAKRYAEQEASNAESSAKSHADQAVEDVEVGGRNYILLDSLHSHRSYNKDVTIVDRETYSIESTQNHSNGHFTLSMEEFSEQTGKWVLSGYMFLNDEPISRDIIWQFSSRYNEYKLDIDPDTGYFEAYWEISENQTYKHFIHAYSSTEFKPDDIIRIEYLKLEKGNKATDWTPAPEDTQEQLDNKTDNEITEQIQDDLSNFEDAKADSDVVDTLAVAIRDYEKALETEQDNVEEAEKNIRDIWNEIYDEEAGILNELGDKSERWEFMDTVVNLDDNGLLIGDVSSNSGVRVDDDRIDFIESGTVVAYITGRTLYIERGIFVRSLTTGEHKQETIEDGISVISWVG